MRIFKSPCPTISIPEVDVYSFLFKSPDFESKAHHKAVIGLADGITYTYGEMKSRVDKFAAGLHQRGFAEGDVLGVYAQNSVDYPTVLYGVLKVGVCLLQ